MLAESCKHFAHRPCFEFSRQEAPNSGSGRMKYDDFEGDDDDDDDGDDDNDDDW